MPYPGLALDDEGRERLLARFGTGAKRWLAALPELVDRCCRQWGLELNATSSGSTSVVLFGRRHGSQGVVLKLTPDPSIADEEAQALRAWAGCRSAVQLLDADPATGALLLERIEPGTRAGRRPGMPAVGEIAQLLNDLRQVDPARCRQLPSLAQRVESLFARVGGLLSDERIGTVLTPDLLGHAHHAGRELAARGPVGLLHGDLHLSNILHGGPARGLVAIDPRPCTGDPTFDAVDWTLYRATSTREVHERIARLCALVPHLDPAGLLRWCQALAPALAALHLRRRPPDETTALLLRLAAP